MKYLTTLYYTITTPIKCIEIKNFKKVALVFDPKNKLQLYSSMNSFYLLKVVPLGLEPRLFWTKTRRVASYTMGHLGRQI